jgi:Glycosyltransferases involved in cell wall biogenesis
MKLIIQIPCYNEELTLPSVIADLPKAIEGIDTIEILIIDDGSTDGTISVARRLGVNHIVKFPGNKGLAKAFMAGMDASLRLGADIIVNTDGDNQYYGGDIPALVEPIVNGHAEIVIGDRNTDSIEHFSKAKKRLQKMGSSVVRKLSRSDVIDTTSGFRAYARDAAMKINVISEYTYTLESIIDAGNKKMCIRNVPIRTNEKLRESRLFKSIRSYIQRSVGTIVRTYVAKHPLRVFLTLAFIFLLIGLYPAIRFLYFYSIGDTGGHIQSLILASILIMIAVILAVFAFLADMNSANRKVMDEILYRIKKLEYDGKKRD